MPRDASHPVFQTIGYAGQLSLHEWGEADDILFLSYDSSRSGDFHGNDPLAEALESSIADKTVTCRYWITDQQCSRDKAQEQFLKMIHGATDIEFGSRYSELTGYLWTDEEVNIGGHDLIRELKSHVGKWLILEFDVH